MLNEKLDIVVADDNPVLIGVLSEIFLEYGHVVRPASGGFLALAEIRKRVPDILLSDLCMPGMSGYELLSVVRRRFPSIRVIAMSGAFTGEAVPTGVAADAFYAKGASSVAKLIQMVNSIWRDDACLLRSVTPVWLAEVASDHAGAPVAPVSCPECLRPFLHSAATRELLSTKCICPHCTTPFEVALVRQSNGMDGTPLSMAPGELPLYQIRKRPRLNDDASSQRIHQQ